MSVTLCKATEGEARGIIQGRMFAEVCHMLAVFESHRLHRQAARSPEREREWQGGE